MLTCYCTPRVIFRTIYLMYSNDRSSVHLLLYSPCHIPFGVLFSFGIRQAPEDGLLWAPVVIRGDPSSSFKAYQAIDKLVDGELRKYIDFQVQSRCKRKVRRLCTQWVRRLVKPVQYFYCWSFVAPSSSFGGRALNSGSTNGCNTCLLFTLFCRRTGKSLSSVTKNDFF